MRARRGTAVAGSARSRWTAGLLAAATAVLAVGTPPAQAAPVGPILGAGAPGSVGGSYIVTLKGDIGAGSAAGRELAGRYGARISHTYGTALNGFSVRVGERQARRLAADSRVASVVQDTAVTVDGSGGALPAAPAAPAAAGAAGAAGAAAAVQKYPPSWGLDRVDQRGLPLDRRYVSPSSGGRGVTVYVIDTGIRTSHRDFGGRASSGWDFVQGDRSAQDGNGHGTHVAATIAGASYGVAKKAKVVAVRVLDDAGAGTTSQVIAGIDWVTRHARKPAVANLSLGGHPNAQLDAAVRASVASGVTYTLAAGNNGRPAGEFSPARVRQAITVGATDGTDARAGFSNFGAAVDLFAPGVGIVSASSRSNTGAALMSGTSMASPHVAGAAALYLSGHRSASPAQVGKVLVAHAATGKVRGAGLGSPNRLLQVGPP